MGGFQSARRCVRSAEWNSAIQQGGTLRYGVNMPLHPGFLIRIRVDWRLFAVEPFRPRSLNLWFLL